MTNVCVIGIYFGMLPNYFKLWLKSAEYNKTIDFLIFTDAENYELPPNVRLAPMTYSEINRRILESTGVTVNIDRPYKFCDLKPMYGLLFEDYLTEYDYWGHCDFDLIWGDIRYFLEKYKLNQYDKFLTLGHLSLYRNTQENNRRFMLESETCRNDYRTVLENEENFAFDELGGIYKIFEEYGFPVFTDRIFADISKIYKRFRLVKYDRNYDYQIFYWENGKVFRKYLNDNQLDLEEYIYIHFKERGFLPYTKDALDSKRFLITSKGFFDADSMDLSLRDIKQYNPYRSAFIEKIEYICYLFEMYLKKIDNRIRTMLKMKKKLR